MANETYNATLAALYVGRQRTAGIAAGEGALASDEIPEYRELVALHERLKGVDLSKPGEIERVLREGGQS